MDEGVRRKDGRQVGNTGYIIAFVTAPIGGYVLSHFIWLNAEGMGNTVTLASAATTAFWVGWDSTTISIGMVMWEGSLDLLVHRLRLLVGQLMVMGAIIASMEVIVSSYTKTPAHQCGSFNPSSTIST